jgi:hypothetical protein
MLNRGVLIVRPKQPYLDWAAALDDSGLAAGLEGEGTVYLIPNFDDEDDGWGIVEEVYAEVFENELLGWHRDESDWPRQRNLEKFLAWFEVELYPVVVDLGQDEIVDEDDAGDED